MYIHLDTDPAIGYLPARASVDHAVRRERLEAALEGLHLADLTKRNWRGGRNTGGGGLNMSNFPI